MDKTILWWNIPSAVKEILTLPEELKDCCDNTEYDRLVADITWFNLPNKIKSAIKELITKTDCYEGLEDLGNINFQWFDIVNAVKILQTEIEDITCVVVEEE